MKKTLEKISYLLFGGMLLIGSFSCSKDYDEPYVQPSPGPTTGGNSGQGNNYGGDNYGGDNNGGGNTGDNNTGGGTQGGDTQTQTRPSAPTGVTVDNYGSVTVPDIRISWNSVSDAKSYRIYRSTRSSGGFSQIGTSSYNFYSDTSVRIGASYYYYVTAVNSKGESEKSSVVQFSFEDSRKPGPPQYGNCTATSTTITLRWTTPTHSSYGTPTKHILRVYNPYSEEWQDLQTLSGTATSASFSYSKYVDDYGYVKCGIIAENDYGSDTSGAKVYDAKNKKWIN